MKVLFIAPSLFSIGELHNAIFLARNLEENGVLTHFLTSQNHYNYAIEAGMKTTALRKIIRHSAIVKQVIEEFKPDAIVFADYHNLDLETELIDLDFVLQFGIPTATIDSLGWAPFQRVLTNQLFLGATERGQKTNIKEVARLREVPKEMKIIRTCPINKPVDDGDRIKVFTLYNKAFTISKDVKRMMKHQFGCEQDSDKLVMVSKATWASLLVKMRMLESKKHMHAAYSYEYLIKELLELYFSVEKLPSKVIVVGISSEQGLVQPNINSEITFVTLPFMSLVEYEKLLFSCDLFITDNITSCSMAKALFGHVPVISLLNTKLRSPKNGQQLEIPPDFHVDERLMDIIGKWNIVLPKGLYPFLTFPNGWVDELKPLLEGNPFLDVIDCSEIFNVKMTGEKIFNFLYCEKTKTRILEKQMQYIEQITNLPDASYMMDFILQK